MNHNSTHAVEMRHPRGVDQSGEVAPGYCLPLVDLVARLS